VTPEVASDTADQQCIEPVQMYKDYPWTHPTLESCIIQLEPEIYNH